MGHILLSESLGGDPNKLRAINNMPPQKSSKVSREYLAR